MVETCAALSEVDGHDLLTLMTVSYMSPGKH